VIEDLSRALLIFLQTVPTIVLIALALISRRHHRDRRDRGHRR